MRGLRARSTSPAGSAGTAEAVYARFLDGEHVWLAVRGATELVLRLPDGSDLPLPAEAGRDGDDDVLVVRYPVAATLAGHDAADLELPLLHVTPKGTQPVTHAASRRKGPALPAPTTRDRRWQYSVGNQGGKVVIKRKPVTATVEVIGFAGHPDGASVRLATTETAAVLVRDDVVVTELPIVDGELVIGDVAGLTPGVTTIVKVGGRSVVRSRNVLGSPQPAVLLPPLPGDLELRWVGGGRLALHRRGEDA